MESNPILLFHALYFAFSAGEDISIFDDDTIAGASPDTACLCNEYNSNRSRFYRYKIIGKERLAKNERKRR